MSRVCEALAVAAAALACASPRPAALAHVSDGRPAMGTLLEVSLYGPDARALARARDRVFARAEELEALFSTYRETSDVSRLNAAGGAPLAVAPELAELLRDALRFSALTRGSFDVTVGPLVSLWVRAAERDRLPGAGEIAAARGLVGAARAHVGADDRVSLDPGARIDLGGVAKGYALDHMLPLLREEGVAAALLSFGQSSVWAIGAPPETDGWTLLVRAPGGGFAGLITLRDLALSVSGSLGQWSEIEGRRYGHVLDPRSGWPLTRSSQALVVGQDAALAEALSKALLILGEAEGVDLVEAQPGCEALRLDAERGPFATRGFAAATRFEALPEPRAGGR